MIFFYLKTASVNPVFKVPFPAVTICPSDDTRKWRSIQQNLRQLANNKANKNVFINKIAMFFHHMNAEGKLKIFDMVKNRTHIEVNLLHPDDR